MTSEINIKLKQVRALLRREKAQGLLVTHRTNFAWLTGGKDSHVRWDSPKGVGSLWVTPTAFELWCDSIEDKRFRDEELFDLPIPIKVRPWLDKPVFPKGKVVSDDGAYGLPSIGSKVARLRWALLPEEITRYRKVGKLAGEAMETVGFRIRRGWTENQVAAELTKELILHGLEACVILVGADERLRRYRHPIPTAHKIQNTVMMVICAKGHGFIGNLTRLVHFGPMPMDLQLRHRACLQVEGAMLAKTKVGMVANEVFRTAMEEYAAQGFEGEWKKHHQGGAAGYETREYLITPDCQEKFMNNQAMAWNVSITGTKSEDTFLVTKKGLDLLTPTPKWPKVKVKAGGKTFERPDILNKNK